MGLIAAVRPQQWTKNLLVFAGLIFAGKFMDPTAILATVEIFVAFCFASSAGYLINDVLDKEGDALHPEKRLRPVASGSISVGAAAATAIILAGLALFIPFATALPYGVAVVGLYLLNQAFYMGIARKVAVLDVFVIGGGFLLRAVAGAVVLDVFISRWLLVCTFLLALFLGFAKRKHEFDLGTAARESLEGYTPALLDHFIVISAAAAVISYGVYAIESSTAKAHPVLFFTIPFPIFGVFRYLQIVYKRNGGGTPEQVLLKDPWMYGTILIWAALSLYSISVTGWWTQ